MQGSSPTPGASDVCSSTKRNKNKQQDHALRKPIKKIDFVLQNAGFKIEKILDSKPSEIAEKLGLDYHIGEIIFKETKKAISKINPDLLLINK